MYGLFQAIIILHTALNKYLLSFSYEPWTKIPVLWRHNKNRIAFKLVVDIFCMKYQRKYYSQHLINTLQEKYQVTQDWTGSLYSGITLIWDHRESIL